MDITYDNGVLTAFLEGEIDHHSAKAMREQIDDKIERHKPTQLILDFAKVSFMDSSGIGLVLGRFKLMEHIGGMVKITSTPKYITKVMKIAGIEKICILENGKHNKTKAEQGKTTVIAGEEEKA